MPQILVRDLSAGTVHQLKRRAHQAGRSLQAEVKQILEREARMMSMDEAREMCDRIRQRIGPQKTDSTDLIREDRDR